MAYIEQIQYNKLPEKWRAVKLDLFNNATTQELAENKRKLKLSVSVQTHKDSPGQWAQYRSGLNLEPRFIYRGTLTDLHDQRHYKMVRELYREIRNELKPERINISKFYPHGNKVTVPNFSCCVALDGEAWYVWLALGLDIFCYCLQGDISTKQQQQGIIATFFASHEGKKPVKTLKDLGLV